MVKASCRYDGKSYRNEHNTELSCNAIVLHGLALICRVKNIRRQTSQHLRYLLAFKSLQINTQLACLYTL